MLAMLKLPDIKAGVILIDPPLAFKTWSRKGEHRAPQAYYDCMSFDELAAIPLLEIAAPDCFLFSWIPPRSVDLVRPLIEAWGFKFSGLGFSWAKQNPSGKGWAMNGGYSTRKNVELCWEGKRGRPKRRSYGVRELIVAPRREHSRKPDEIYDRIEALCDGPYLEIFARQQWPGWVCVGNEVDKYAPGRAAKPVRAFPKNGDQLELGL
jgi:N6-adenosine-specific RNA methylase IME4